MTCAQWHLYPNFTAAEFDCQETGENNMQHEFIQKLQKLRSEFGKPIVISSGFRSVKHSMEKKKTKPGVHSSGYAADITISRGDAHELLRLAFLIGFSGIGVQQKGSGRFLHLDDAPAADWPRPMIWSY